MTGNSRLLPKEAGNGALMTLVRIVKDWDWPDIMRQTPGGKGVWDDVCFTTGEVDECDALLVLNNRMKQEVRAVCPRGRVWALMQEPYHRGFTDWMVEGLDVFARVYTNYVPSGDPKYVISHPAIPWHVNRTFDQLTTQELPEKSGTLSWVVGNCRDLPGHLERLAFLRRLQMERDIPADLFGRAVRPIEDKWDGLAPYRFSLAVENTVADDYWTEKLADCFLSWTIPIYHGCPNLAQYFPSEAFISIDINKPCEALAVIRKIVKDGASEWERRLPALHEARRLILYHYQLFPVISKLLLLEDGLSEERSLVIVPPYKRSLKARFRRDIAKIRKLIRCAKGIL